MKLYIISIACFILLAIPIHAVNVCCYYEGDQTRVCTSATLCRLSDGYEGDSCTVDADCYPKASSNSTNSTTSGTPIEFRLKWSQDVAGVPTLSKAITSLWNGSAWVNASSWCSLTGFTSWCNQTLTVNSTPQQLWWKGFANDSWNGWTVSQNYSIITCYAGCDFCFSSLPYNISQSGKTYCLIKDVSTSSEGINFTGSIINNSVLDCNGYEINGTNSFVGVYIKFGKNNTVKNCVIKNNKYGIRIDNANEENYIINNTLINNTYQYFDTSAIELFYSNNQIIENNTLINNKFGINLDASNNNTLNNNGIYNLSSIYYTGIRLSESNNNTLINNKIINNMIEYMSLECINSSNNNITSNQIMNNKYGIRIDNTSFLNNITSNQIMNNTNNDVWLSFNNVSCNNRFQIFNTNKFGIYFQGNNSCFSYSNDTNIVINSISSNVYISRELLKWKNEILEFFDTPDEEKIMEYNISGLLLSQNYSVYNNSILAYTLETDSSGILPQFSINLTSSEHNITVIAENVTVPNVTELAKCEYFCNSFSDSDNPILEHYARNNDVFIGSSRFILMNLDSENLTNMSSDCLIYWQNSLKKERNLCINLNSKKAIYVKELNNEGNSNDIFDWLVSVFHAIFG